MRYASPSPFIPAQESALARAKNTSRAEARRRTRDIERAELAGDELSEESTDALEATPAAQPRRPMFRMPDIRSDLKALPQTFMSRRLMWLPLLLLLVGFGLTLIAPGMDVQVQGLMLLFVQFFFVPPALFTFFIAGFVSPRSSYLVGLLYGLLAGVLWATAFLYMGTDVTGGTGAPGLNASEPLAVFSQMLVIGALYGTLAAAFAAWYRDFLRQMQQRGQQRRADQETRQRDQRRTERQEARKQAKQRPT